MARPPEIDGKLVVRLRKLSPPVPWVSIAQAMGVSRSGVVQAYRREMGLVVLTAPRCPNCNAPLACANEGCDAA